MLERLAGNDALKAELGTALRGGRLPHAVLLVGEPGCGAGFAARCLAADYLYPAGGPHAEAVLKKEDTECLVLQGEGASGQIPVKKVREAREAIQRSALSTDAAGRVLFIYGAQNLNGSSANAMLKIIEEPPEGVLFLLTATSAATVLPTIRSRCAAYTIAPVPAADCAARLKAERLPAKAAEELAFLYEGHIGTALERPDGQSRAGHGQNAVRLCGAGRHLPRAGAADEVRARQGRLCGPAVDAGPAVQRRAAPPRLRAGAVRRADPGGRGEDFERRRPGKEKPDRKRKSAVKRGRAGGGNCVKKPSPERKGGPQGRMRGNLPAATH